MPLSLIAIIPDNNASWLDYKLPFCENKDSGTRRRFWDTLRLAFYVLSENFIVGCVLYGTLRSPSLTLT